jgi:hypothetical protein
MIESLQLENLTTSILQLNNLSIFNFVNFQTARSDQNILLIIHDRQIFLALLLM